MSYKKNKYKVVKKIISKDLANFCFNYFLIKKQVAKTLFERNHISPFDQTFGIFGDPQAPNTYSHYADIVMETLLLRCQSIMEKETGKKLIPTYSYARLYKNGDVLERHKDRYSCEISTTMFLGGEPWPIFLSPFENVGALGPKRKPGVTFQSNAKGVKVNLKEGDMLIYNGAELEHWREAFDGQDCAQVFLHYNEDTADNRKRIFDSRPHIGLPAYTKTLFNDH